MDEARELGITIDVEGLQKKLGIPVVATVGISGRGMRLLKEAIANYTVRSNGLNIDYGLAIDRAARAISRIMPDTTFTHRATALLALQGPESAGVLAALHAGRAAELGRFRFAELDVAGIATLVSRTGYTGSDGFELYLPGEAAGRLWDALLEAGAPKGLAPAGLGARDTLRLEAALPLYGHELDDETSPLEATLDRFVDVMLRIAEEVERDPESLARAPQDAPIGRADEVTAARRPIVVWDG